MSPQRCGAGERRTVVAWRLQSSDRRVFHSALMANVFRPGEPHLFKAKGSQLCWGGVGVGWGRGVSCNALPSGGEPGSLSGGQPCLMTLLASPRRRQSSRDGAGCGVPTELAGQHSYSHWLSKQHFTDEMTASEKTRAELTTNKNSPGWAGQLWNPLAWPQFDSVPNLARPYCKPQEAQLPKQTTNFL